MTTITQQAMQAYYSRDPDALRRLVDGLVHEAEQLRAYVAGNSLGPSSGPADTGRNERGIAPVSGLRNS